jgi:hypothetical protein
MTQDISFLSFSLGMPSDGGWSDLQVYWNRICILPLVLCSTSIPDSGLLSWSASSALICSVGDCSLRGWFYTSFPLVFCIPLFHNADYGKAYLIWFWVGFDDFDELMNEIERLSLVLVSAEMA